MKHLHWRALSAVVVLGSLTACDEDQVTSRAATLVNVEVEAEGDHCESGGQRIETGVDSNRDGELSRDEVVKTTYACNGSNGAVGESGESGGDGAPGQSSLVDVDAEAAGKNCTAGGQKVSTGLDADGDAVLDAAEVQNVFYVCQGGEGLRSVVATTAEPAGEHCPDAGQKLLHGMDLDHDGALDADEIEGETYLCNGALGATGAVSLVAVTDEPAGEHCTAGGKRIDTGVDGDESDALEAGEIAETSYVCNGVEGAASLVLLTKELAGENCAAGGQRIDQGIDDNGDRTLQPEELDETRYVCNGTDGTDGFSTLITVTPIAKGATCANGGQALAIGLDNGDGAGTPRNGALEEGEVDSTANLCSGVDGQDGQDGEDGQDGQDGEDGVDGQDGVDGAGGVHLIDANGFDLGRMVGSGGFMTNNMTMISTKGYTYSLYYYNLSYYPSTIYFTNNDCTGTSFTYSPVQGGQNAIGGLFASYVDSVGWFASLPNTYATSRSYASYRGNTTCYANSGTTNGFTVVPTTAQTVGLPATAPATPASLQ